MAKYAPLDYLDSLNDVSNQRLTLWSDHVVAWASCIAKYDLERSEYDQGAFNICMQARDTLTKVCWSNGPPPTDVCMPRKPSPGERQDLLDVTGLNNQHVEARLHQLIRSGGGTSSTPSNGQLEPFDGSVPAKIQALAEVAIAVLDLRDSGGLIHTLNAFQRYRATRTPEFVDHQVRDVNNFSRLLKRHCSNNDEKACAGDQALTQILDWMRSEPVRVSQ